MARLLEDSDLDGQVTIDSAGTGAWHVGELADPRTRRAARERGIDLTHRARQFTRRDLERFDLVLAMDHDNYRHLSLLVGKRSHPELRLLRSFDPDAPPEAEVPDPYYEGDDGFEIVLDQCERACAGLLAHVRERLG